MKTGSALLHHWSVPLGEFDFTIRHWPGKAQTHVDGLSRLPIEQAPPDGEEAALIIQPLVAEETTRQAAWELHHATHVGGGGDALWKVFRDCFSYSEGKRICLEVTRFCI